MNQNELKTGLKLIVEAYLEFKTQDEVTYPDLKNVSFIDYFRGSLEYPEFLEMIEETYEELTKVEIIKC